MSRGADTGLWLALCLWGAGVQLNEALASAGLALCVVFAVMSAWPQRQRWRELVSSWLPLWIFSVWAVGAPLLAGRVPTGTGAARLGDWLALPAAAYGVGRLTPGRFRIFLAACVGVSLLSCLAAGLQSYGLWPSQEAADAALGLQFPMQRIYEEAPGGRFMGGGLLFHRLKFAHVESLVVISAFAFALRTEGRQRILAATVAALGAYAVAVFPFARGALAALALTLAMVAVVCARRRLQTALVATSCLVVIAAGVRFSPSLRERFGASFGDEEGRRALWSTGLDAAASHPWVGLGLGRFHPAAFAPRDRTVHEAAGIVKAHNQLLTVTAETGWTGAGLFLAFLVWLGLQLAPARPEGAAALGALSFFVLLSLAHDPLFHAPFSMALVLQLGQGMGRARR